MKKYFLLIVIFFITSCGMSKGYYTKVRDPMLQRNYTAADELISKNKEEYGERNALLYYLDRGIILHLQGNYKESNRYFDLAEKLVDELYTVRLSKEAGGFILNDNALPYAGEDFERVLINMFSSLNYLFLKEWDEALVECRKVDKKLDLYNSKYEKKAVYKEDAFIRYLSALLFEAKNEINDAFIDYRKSYDIYQEYQRDYNTQTLPFLSTDLLRTSLALGFDEEYDFYKKKFPEKKIDKTLLSELKGKGELIFIHYNGEMAYKDQYEMYVPIQDFQIIKLAFPKFVQRSFRIDHAVVKVLNTGEEVRTFLGEDISAIAIKNLEDRIARISVKTIARATAKAIASRAAGRAATNDETGQKLVTFLTQTVANLTEEADLRSWRTLPAQIHIGRMNLPPGKYDLNISFRTTDGLEVENLNFPGVEIKSGAKKFLAYRTYQ